jgi:Fuc2NAc and GlcNAc transferase
MMSWFSFILLLFALSWAGVGMFRAYAIEKGMLDKPSQRSSHIAATARGGGVVIFLGWFALLAVFHFLGMINKAYIWNFLPALFIGFVGFRDDRKPMSADIRFVLQSITAVVSLFILGEGGTIIQSILPFSVPLPICFGLLIFIMVWFVNLYNFMDGADGIAAMQAIFVFGVGGYFLYQSGAYELATLGWGLVALLFGFLIWNWPTARIFMGDSGSYFLGFLMVLYALLSAKFYNLSPLFWIMLTAPFWFDASVTLVRRIIAKDNWRKPHRLHAYQRLIQVGWSHQQVLFSVIAVDVIISGLALFAFRDPRLMTFSCGMTLTLVVCLYLLIELKAPMYKKWY